MLVPRLTPCWAACSLLICRLIQSLGYKIRFTIFQYALFQYELCLKIYRIKAEHVLFQMQLFSSLQVYRIIHCMALHFTHDAYKSPFLSKILGKLQKGIQSLKEGNWSNKKFCLFIWRWFFLQIFWIVRTKRHLSVSLVPCSIKRNAIFGAALPRTLGMNKRDHKRFLKYGKAKIASAKRYHNCVRSPLLDFQPSEFVLPYLHILSGIMLKHHNMLEDSTHEIGIVRSFFSKTRYFSRDCSYV